MPPCIAISGQEYGIILRYVKPATARYASLVARAEHFHARVT